MRTFIMFATIIGVFVGLSVTKSSAEGVAPSEPLRGLSPSDMKPEVALQQSPITPGFWSWPREKTTDPRAVAAACRANFAAQFADGHYFGVRLQKAGKSVSPPEVDEVGVCKFDADTQIETCSLRVDHVDGSVENGVIESRFATGGDGAIKMTVTPLVGGVRGQPFDVYPVRCPDAEIWSGMGAK